MPDSRSWTTPLGDLLLQGAELAATLEAEAFAAASPLSPDGSVGAHLRHVADFVEVLLRDVDARRIDYDHRARDARIERDPSRARAHLARLAQELGHLQTLAPDLALEVRSEACLVGPSWQRSTLARELVVLLSHAIHHYALIAVLLRARGLAPPPDFGIAPSTLAHWRKERTACAPRAG